MFWNLIQTGALPRSWLFADVDEAIHGTTADVLLPYNAGSAGADPVNFTVALEFKAVGTPGQYDVVCGAMNAFSWTQGFGIHWESSTTIRCWGRHYATEKYDITGITASNWNHIAFTFHSNSVSGVTLKAYLNGSYVGEFTGATHRWNFMGTTCTFKVGRDNDNSTVFPGHVRRVGVWDRVLTAGEITTISALNYNYTGTHLTDLRLYWAGTDADSTTTASGILDSSGNGYHGTGQNLETGDLTTEVRVS